MTRAPGAALAPFFPGPPEAECGPDNALDYAAKTFDIRAVGDRFEAILARAARHP